MRNIEKPKKGLSVNIFDEAKVKNVLDHLYRKEKMILNEYQYLKELAKETPIRIFNNFVQMKNLKSAFLFSSFRKW